MTKQFHSVLNHTRLYETILEHTRLAKTIKDYDQILSRKISLFERKDTEDKPRDYLLGINGRLQEVFRVKLGLHGGMTIQDI